MKDKITSISSLLSIFCTLISCATQKAPSSFPIGFDYVVHLEKSSNTTYVWKIDSLNNFDTDIFFSSDLSNIKNISMEKRKFKLKNDLFLSSNMDETSFQIYLINSKHSFIITDIQNNKILYSCEYNNGTIDWKKNYHDELGNIKRIDIASLQNELFFDKGTGYYKDIYRTIIIDTVKYNKPSDIKSIQEYDNGLLQRVSFRILNDSLARKEQEKNTIKEEGNIKNNYKIGRWKYYDQSGKFEVSKEYKIEDKVDVRFPYCLYNKQEPCFCGE